MKNRRDSNTRCGETSELKRVTGMRWLPNQRSPSDPSTAGPTLPNARVSGPANISGRTMLLTSAACSAVMAFSGFRERSMLRATPAVHMWMCRLASEPAMIPS